MDKFTGKTSSKSEINTEMLQLIQLSTFYSPHFALIFSFIFHFCLLIQIAEDTSYYFFNITNFAVILQDLSEKTSLS